MAELVAAANAVGGIAKLALALYDPDVVEKNSVLVSDMRKRADRREIVPETVSHPPKYMVTPLMNHLFKSYQTKTTGMSHVVYAPSSIGKTTAGLRFVSHLLAKNGAPGIMFTSPLTADYFGSMALHLKVNHPLNWLICLVAALKCAPNCEQPAGVLILDEFNFPGEAGVNMQVAECLMRYLHSTDCNFQLYFITQNVTVANELCALNRWQKIGPLEGLSDPTRSALLESGGPIPKEVPWEETGLLWPKEALTELVIIHCTKEKCQPFLDENGVLNFVKDGMMPTYVLFLADKQVKSEPEVPAGTDWTVLASD